MLFLYKYIVKQKKNNHVTSNICNNNSVTSLCRLKYTVPLWWESWVCSFHHRYPAAEFHVTTPLVVVACRYVDSSSVPQNERLGAEQCWQHNPCLHPEAYKITSMFMLCLKNSGSLSLKTAYSAAAASPLSNHFLELWSSDHNQIAWMQIEERFDPLKPKHAHYYDAFFSRPPSLLLNSHEKMCSLSCTISRLLRFQCHGTEGIKIPSSKEPAVH